MKWVAECYSTPKKLTSISKIEIETISKTVATSSQPFLFIKNVEERGEKCGIFVIFALIFYFETN